ncbi:hypothetical protein FKM82_022686, partial [Ascaphus truei]
GWPFSFHYDIGNPCCGLTAGHSEKCHLHTHAAADMLTNWHFKYLMLGNLWCLVHARKDQVTQLNMTVACSEDTVLLCIVNGDQGFSCLCNMTWSNAVEEACGDGQHVSF